MTKAKVIKIQDLEESGGLGGPEEELPLRPTNHGDNVDPETPKAPCDPADTRSPQGHSQLVVNGAAAVIKEQPKNEEPVAAAV